MATKPQKQSNWTNTITMGFRATFTTDPDVHTFLALATESGDVSGKIREVIRDYINRNQHPAGNPEVQRQTALKGMQRIIEASVQGDGSRKGIEDSPFFTTAAPEPMPIAPPQVVSPVGVSAPVEEPATEVKVPGIVGLMG